MIGPSSTRRRAAGETGDWPCFADRTIVVLPSRWRWWIAWSIRPTSASTKPSARVSSGPGVPALVYPPVSPSDVGSFSAVETVWKFIPKTAGVPTFSAPEWSRPSISFRTAATLNESYSAVSALSVVQSSPAASATLLISGVKRSSMPVPDGPFRIS